ncbi:MAG: ATP-binding protein, partial [Dysgonamonadaceae bacterium]|nr:ATP-binding protein [Dysgonamonadaceae bacterium]
AGSEIASEDIKIAYIDMFSIRGEIDFYNAYTKAILLATSSKLEETIQNAKQFFKHIIPKLSLGLDPMTDFSLSFSWDEIQQNTEEILDFSEKIAKAKDIRLVVCIDEFQNISSYGDSLAFQKLLRSVWQKHENTCYCLYGSKFHTLQELFERQSMPFYRFGDLIHLDKISEENWFVFIKEKFEQTHKQISDDLILKIIHTVVCHPYYVQQLSHLIWGKTINVVDENIFDSALDDMIQQNALLYQRDTENMSAYQINFLRAIANGVTTNLSSTEVINKYRLGSSANVAKIKKYMINQEIIDVRKKEYYFIDPVYELWFREEM